MLIQTGMQWVRACSHRMDQHLRQTLRDLYQPLSRYPRFMRSYMERRWSRRMRIPVIIEFHKHEESYSAGLSQLHEHMKEHKRCRMGQEMPYLYCCSAELTPAAVERLLQPEDCHSRVTRVYLDRTCTAHMDTARASVRAEQLQTEGLTGAGVTIAVLDTGVYPHPDLVRPVNRIVAFQDYTRGRTSPYDDNGHGTHVAGCALGNGQQSNSRYRGVAPAARLAAVKVLDKKGNGPLSAIMAGINWCISNKDIYSIRIMNLSLGTPATVAAENDPLVQSVNAAWSAGIVVCCAAGNAGPEPGTVTSPGISPFVITVGAMNDMNTPEREQDAAADFSSRGPTPDGQIKPDLLVPGVDIVSLRSPSSTLDRQEPQARVGSDYFSLTGTSMAAPVCSGVAALLLQRTPEFKPDDVKRELLAAAENWGLAHNIQGRGYLDARDVNGL